MNAGAAVPPNPPKLQQPGVADIARPHRKGRSIRLTLLVILLATLLPLAILTTLQGVARLQYERQDLRDRLSDAALLTAYSEQNSFTRAQSLLDVLGTAADIVDVGPRACGARLAEVRDALPAYSHFSVIGPDGVIRCAANPVAVGVSVADQPFWRDLQGGGGFTITPPVRGRFSGGVVIWAVHPLRAEDGSFDGAITASIDLDELRKLLQTRQADSNALVAVADGRGTPVVSSQPLPWSRVPIADKPGGGGVMQTGDGQPWSYSTAPLHVGSRPDNSLYILYAARRPTLFSEGNYFLFSYFTLPIAALIIASIGIWLGTNRAILRWVSELGGVAQEVGKGEYRVPVRQFTGAPAEMRGLATELRRMARLISRRDRTLKAGLQHQKALTRELHHRVRNNLQVIASFLALRQQAVSDPAAARALAEARMHVGVLGAVYRLLYDRGELTPVSAGLLFETTVPMVARDLGRTVRFSADPEAADLHLGIDSAVAVALWTLQSLVLMAETEPVPAPPVEGSLRLDDGRLALSFESAGEAWAPRDSVSSLMLEGLARQLGGTFTEYAESGRRGIILRWPARP